MSISWMTAQCLVNCNFLFWLYLSAATTRAIFPPRNRVAHNPGVVRLVNWPWHFALSGWRVITHVPRGATCVAPEIQGDVNNGPQFLTFWAFFWNRAFNWGFLHFLYARLFFYGDRLLCPQRPPQWCSKHIQLVQSWLWFWSGMLCPLTSLVHTILS